MFTVRTFLAGCALLTASQVMAGTDVMTRFYLNKGFWERMQWSGAHTSQLWTIPKWLPYDGRQDDVQTFTSQLLFTYQGNKFTANLAYHNVDADSRYFTSLNATVSKSTCDDLLKIFGERFGNPVINDGTAIVKVLSDSRYLKWYTLAHQWDLGETRIGAHCSAMLTSIEDANKSIPYMFSVKAADQSQIKKLVPKFLLRCSRRFSHVSKPYTPFDMDDLVVWVDTYNSNVISPELYRIATNIDVSDDRISFRLGRAEKVFIYNISRITGALSGEYHDGTDHGTRIAGTCERLTEVKTRF